MTDYTNWKIKKSLIHYIGDDIELNKKKTAAMNEYSEVSSWCIEKKDYCIDDDDMYYFVNKSHAPSKETLLHQEYMELKNKLKLTDYITNKLAEVVDDMVAYNEMKEHYSEQLSQRKFWRQRIREIEEELKENNTNEF